MSGQATAGGAGKRACPATRSQKLLLALNLGREQPNFVYDLGAMGNIDYLGDILELDTIITFYEHHSLGAGLKDVRKLVAQIVPRDIGLVDPECWFAAL